jgi:hypothetical protein
MTANKRPHSCKPIFFPYEVRATRFAELPPPPHTPDKGLYHKPRMLAFVMTFLTATTYGLSVA